MREILFRGKKQNGEWLHGDLVHYGDKILIFSENAQNSPDYYEVNPETVGQFTGKHDINSKMIFEKDQIKWAGEDTVYTVEFEGGSFICVSADTVFNLSDYADCEYELI